MHGKEATDLPDLLLRPYDTGVHTIVAACTGPDDGLTAVKRSKAHLTLGDDIDFIDIAIEDPEERKSAPKPGPNYRNRYQQQLRQRLAASNAAKQAASDQNANKPPKPTSIEPTNGIRPRKLSKSEPPTGQTDAVTKIHQLKTETNASGTINVIVSMIKTTHATNASESTISSTTKTQTTRPTSDNINQNVVEAAKENISPNDRNTGNQNGTESNDDDFLPADVMTASTILNCNTLTSPDEYAGITNWQQENEHAYGVSISLYEKNFITREAAGSPIADCYGCVMRGNSVALALADGVNWGKHLRSFFVQFSRKKN